jgi:hypothetical protein
MEEQNEPFSFIKENCNESKMYRNAYLGGMTLRDAADNAFLSLLTLYLFYKEFETSPSAREYARKTMMFGNWNTPRVAGTDLYQALHIMSQPEGKTADQLKAKDQNRFLAQKLHVNLKFIREFLRGMVNGNLDRAMAVRTMYRLEGQMAIGISNYKSLRRMITDWENLTKFQKAITVTRLLQYFRVRARRSDLYPMLETLAKGKGWEVETTQNSELGDIGPTNGIHGTSSSDKFIKAVGAAAAGFGAGYFAARALGRPSSGS